MGLAPPLPSVVWRRDDGSPDRVRLLYQQTFQAPSASGNRREWSGERRPDYVLSFEGLGVEGAWVILDAKYRSSQTFIHEALTDLHVYRDALRHRERKGAMAFIIVPALDPNAAVYAAADYVGAHAFGAIISAQGHDSVAAALHLLTDCVIGAAPFLSTLTAGLRHERGLPPLSDHGIERGDDPDVLAIEPPHRRTEHSGGDGRHLERVQDDRCTVDGEVRIQGRARYPTSLARSSGRRRDQRGPSNGRPARRGRGLR
nr:nuclease domain-containing protein [Azospirillum sp.]